MKRHNLLLLTFLLSHTTSVYAMEPAEQNRSENSVISKKSILSKNPNSLGQAQNLQDMISEAIALTEKKISEYNPMSPKVIVIGPSKSGKSTLFNLLAGQPCVVDDEFRIDVIDPIQGSEPGHGTTSKTTLPSLYKGPNDMIVWDCPGFGDTGGPEKDIVNLGMIRKLFSGPVKILLTTPETSVAGTGEAFIKLMTYVTQVFSYDQLEESLSLVVTKQGEVNGTISPHVRLKRLLTHNQNEPAYFMHEDVKKLLTHLTKEENINIRIPYFPFPKDLGDYPSEQIKINILESINALTPIPNPELNIQLSPEANILITNLAKNLNGDVTNTLEKVFKPKVIQLCEQYTNAYASDGNMQQLESCLKAVKSALTFLTDASEASMLKFTCSFNEIFNFSDNVIKKYVKTLLFLKTLQVDIECSTKTWICILQPTFEKITELIDSLGNRLSQKITTFMEETQCVISQSCATLPNDQNRDAYMRELAGKLDHINMAIEMLQSATPETTVEFVGPFGNFFSQNHMDTIKAKLETLKFLSTLKKMDYPKGNWQSLLQTSATHIQNKMTEQQKIIDLNRRLEEERLRKEEERLRREEEARVRAEQEAERQRLAEIAAAQQAEDLRLVQVQAENERRAHEAEAARLQEAARQAEVQRLAQEEATRIRAEEAAEAQRQREIREAEAARVREEDARVRAAQEAERQRLADIAAAQQAEALRLVQVQAEMAAQAQAAEIARLQAATRQAEVQRLAQEEAAKIRAEQEAERQRLADMAAAQQAEALRLVQVQAEAATREQAAALARQNAEKDRLDEEFRAYQRQIAIAKDAERQRQEQAEALRQEAANKEAIRVEAERKRLEEEAAVLRQQLAAEQEEKRLAMLQQKEDADKTERQRLLRLKSGTVISVEQYNLLPEHRRRVKTVPHRSYKNVRGPNGGITRKIVTTHVTTTYYTKRSNLRKVGK